MHGNKHLSPALVPRGMLRALKRLHLAPPQIPPQAAGEFVITFPNSYHGGFW